MKNIFFIKKRIKEAKKYIRNYDSNDFEVFQNIYRAYHHSYKICYIRSTALKFLFYCLYIIGYIDKNEGNTLDCLVKHIRRQSFTWYIIDKIIRNDVLAKQKGYNIETSKFVLPYLGGVLFFKTILKSLIKYSDACNYVKKKGFIDFYEGNARYFLDDLKERKTKDEI